MHVYWFRWRKEVRASPEVSIIFNKKSTNFACAIDSIEDALDFKRWQIRPCLTCRSVHYSICATMPKPRYATLNFEQQLQVCAAARAFDLSPPELVLWAVESFKLPIPISHRTITRILKREPKLIAVAEKDCHRKTFVQRSLAQFDERLAKEVDKAGFGTETVAGRHVVRLAKMVADELSIPPTKRQKFSNGWLYRFQKRNGIRLTVKHGESASVNLEQARIGRHQMRKITDLYPLENIYNMDEAALSYRLYATKTLSRQKRLAGRKLCKDRLTLALAVNGDGTDKLPPLLIGTAKVPHCLRNVDVSREFGVMYTNSGKAWMNSKIFRTWLLDLNASMRQRSRKILLLVDNVSSHKRPADELTHVWLEFLL